MRIRITTRAGVGVFVSCVALLAGAPSASALSGAGFVPNDATDSQFISHGSGVYNTDTNAEHWVNGYLGVFAPVSGMTTRFTYYGFALGESRVCRVYVKAVGFTDIPQRFDFVLGPTTGNFSATFNLPLIAQSHLSVSCNLGRATSSQYNFLYGAYVTQSP